MLQQRGALAPFFSFPKECPRDYLLQDVSQYRRVKDKQRHRKNFHLAIPLLIYARDGQSCAAESKEWNRRLLYGVDEEYGGSRPPHRQRAASPGTAFTHAKSDTEPVHCRRRRIRLPGRGPAIPQARNIQVNSIICVWGMKK